MVQRKDLLVAEDDEDEVRKKVAPEDGRGPAWRRVEVRGLRARFTRSAWSIVWCLVVCRCVRH